MKLLAKRFEHKIPVLSLVISIIVSWLLVPPTTGFPMVAFFIFYISLGTLVYLVRKEKSAFDTMLYVGILLLSFFTIYRANSFLEFLDFLFIIFFGSLLINPLIHKHGLIDLLLSPFIVVKDTLIAKNMFPYKLNLSARYRETRYTREYFPTIAITGLIMIITIPLLASANPFFNALFQNILKAFDLERLFGYIFADQISVYIGRIVVLIFLSYFIPRTLTVSVQGTKSIEIKQLFSINYMIPKFAMAAILIIFFITQLQLYFATPQALQSMGYTNSRLTNEVFAQVTFVAFIVFLLAYLDKSKELWSKRLTFFLAAEALFLIGIAFKSVYDYTALWGFTQKRLWGYTSMTWLTGVFAAFIYHYSKQALDVRFIKQVIVYTIGILLLVNILNFDYLIYRFAKASTPAGIDYEYLSSLSADAHYYRDTLTKLMAEIEKSNSIDYTKTRPVYNILSHIDYLRYKYSTRRDIGSFNISEYQEYLGTKDVDVAGYSRRLFEIQQNLNPRSQPVNWR